MDYSKLTKVYLDLEKTTKRLEKTEILAKFLKKVFREEIKEVIYLLQGRVFPQWDQRKIGFSNRLIIKVIASSTGNSASKVEDLWKSKGDLGKVVQTLVEKKKQATLAKKKLTIRKVFENIRKLPEFQGLGTIGKKINLVAELLTSANPVEARFVVSTILEQLRVGVASGLIRDAIAQTFNVDVKDVESAYNLTVDYGEVALIAKTKGKKGLTAVGLKVGMPTECMLAIKVNNIKEGFDAVGSPALIDYKLDGFRVFIHKEGNKFWFFTRRMENVLKQFEELIPILKKNVKGDSYILDTEVVGYNPKTGKYMPFQTISQRIKRKYHIEKIAKEFPVEINAFDLLYYNGKNLMNKPLKERRKILNKIIKEKKKEIVIPKWIITDDVKKASGFYKTALKEGLEGVMMKNLNATYKPGRYVEGWVKVKTILEPLDLTITKCYSGEGKRAGWLTSYTIACRFGNKFLEVGKVSTGVKEKAEGMTYKEMTRLLKPLIISTKGKEVTVKPEIVIEVGYEEIQKSPKYSSGYALRFPRFLRLRAMEKKPKDVNTLEDIKMIYNKQKKS